MTDLRRLSVSLTKHGAHKIAAVLLKYDKDDALNRLQGIEPGVNIDLAQARRTLSADDDNRVPDVWRTAQRRGTESVNALVLLAIIFSHHRLIEAMRLGRQRTFSGVIKKGKLIDGKAFTNFAHEIEQLGFSTSHTSERVAYNLEKLFRIAGLNELFASLVALKLEEAGWDKKNGLIEEAIRLGFHGVLAIDEVLLRTWLTTGLLEQSAEASEDFDFFFAADERSKAAEFVFQPGHNTRKTGSIEFDLTKKRHTASLLHNEVQNGLFAELVKKFGEKNVGTENPTGLGTAIDIVVKIKDDSFWFYEIKTAASARMSIRQALPQLLEYAYWRGDGGRAERLIIVSPEPINEEAERYLQFLRDRFNLPVFYEQYQVKGA